MTETQESPAVPPVHRRRWVMPLVVAAVGVVGIGIGIGVGLAASDSDDATPSAASTAQLADVHHACMTWTAGAGAGQSAAGWCQHMTGWMAEQMASGSMMGQMMWGDAERMLSTCRAWMDADPPSGVPADWCSDMMTGMWPDLDDEWSGGMGGPMMGG